MPTISLIGSVKQSWLEKQPYLKNRIEKFGYDLIRQIFLRKHSFEIANLSTLFLQDILGKMNFVRKLLSKQ